MKIAVLRRGGIGDLLCTAPLIHSLLQDYENPQITLFLEERSKAIAPFFLESFLPHPVSCSWILEGNKYYQSLKKAFLFRKTFDLALCAKTTPMKLGDRFLRLLGAPISMAVSTSNKISHPRAAMNEGHQALRALRIARPDMQSIPEHWLPSLSIPEMGLDLPRPILFFSLSNRRAASQLSISRFALLANRLPFSILINASEERKEAKELQNQLKNPSQILYTPHINKLLQALKASDLVLTGDGGLSHMAAALKVPQLALYACTPLDLWAPLGPATCLYHPENVNKIELEDIFLRLSRFF